MRSYAEEQDLVGYPGSNIPIRVASDDGTTATVITQGAGVHVRGDQTYTVPSTAINNGHY